MWRCHTGGHADDGPGCGWRYGGHGGPGCACGRRGSSKGQSDTVVNAINQRLKQDNSQACNGQFKIAYEDMDDATAAAGKWDPTQEANNANKAAADADVMVYIGTFNSGAAKVSIPILNQAGLVMISPANTYPGLTKPGKGEAGEPEK